MKRIRIILAIVAACTAALLWFGPAQAQDVDAKRVSDTKMEVCITPPQGVSIKDFHVAKGSLPDGAAVKVTNDQGLNWASSVKWGYINVWGANALPGKTCFTLELPAGHKWSQLKLAKVITTDDGDQNANTGQVSTHTQGAYLPVSAVGGTVELLVDSSDSPARASEGGGAASFPFPAIAGTAAAAGALALVAGGWYARRRFSKG